MPSPPKRSQVSRKKTAAPELKHSEPVRGAFLTAGRKLFAERGFDGVSVKDLALETGHNAALVNYYFEGKEGLYEQCIMPLIGVGVASIERSLRNPISKQDFLTRFELFIEEFILSHLKEQELCVILRRDSNTDVVKKIYKEHFIRLFDRLHAFFKAAKRLKLLHPDTNTELTTHLVSASLFDLVTIDRLREDCGQTLFLNDQHCAATIRQATQYVMHGILKA